MALPQTVAVRVLVPGDMLGLRMATGSGDLSRTFWWRIDTAEPAKLEDFSIGAANAQAVAGTTWNEILKSGTNQSYLEPDQRGIINQLWWGVTPSIAWVYLQYPPSRDRLSLLGTRAIGDQQGYWTGRQSSPSIPAPETELYTMNGLHPAFNGYHPFLAPASITVRLTFWLWRFGASLVGVTSPDEAVPQGVPGVIGRTLLRSVGGISLVAAPLWVTDLAASRADWKAKLEGAGTSHPLGAPVGGIVRAEAPYSYR